MVPMNQGSAAWAILTLLFGGALYLSGQLHDEHLGAILGGPLFGLGLIWLLFCVFGKR